MSDKCLLATRFVEDSKDKIKILGDINVVQCIAFLNTKEY